MGGSQRTAVAAAAQPRYSIPRVGTGRFGDGELRERPPKRPQPAAGGASPVHAARAGFYRREDAQPSIGSGPTTVERWRYSEPGGAAASKNRTRRPHEHDWIDGLGPARYQPERLAAVASGGRLAPCAPCISIGAQQGGGPPRLGGAAAPAPLGGNDLMYSLPQSIDVRRLRSPGTFGTTSEGRLAPPPVATAEAEAHATTLLQKKVRRGLRLSDEERAQLRRDLRSPHEHGSSASRAYMPHSVFGRSGGGRGSGSYAFSSSTGSFRFERGRPELERAVSAAAAWPRERCPPHGGRMGVAFRAEPRMSPGPGDYHQPRGFDGTGRALLSHARSTPAVGIGATSRDITVITGHIEQRPPPGAYFVE